MLKTIIVGIGGLLVAGSIGVGAGWMSVHHPIFKPESARGFVYFPKPYAPNRPFGDYLAPIKAVGLHEVRWDHERRAYPIVASSGTLAYSTASRIISGCSNGQIQIVTYGYGSSASGPAWVR